MSIEIIECQNDEEKKAFMDGIGAEYLDATVRYDYTIAQIMRGNAAVLAHREKQAEVLRIDSLRNALERYGWHAPLCAALDAASTDMLRGRNDLCTCGLSDALKGK